MREAHIWAARLFLPFFYLSALSHGRGRPHDPPASRWVRATMSACPIRWTPLPGTRGPCVPVSSDRCGSAIRPRAPRCIRCLGPACIQKNGRTTENHGPVPGKRAGPPPNQAILNKHRGFSSKHESFQVGPFGPIGPFGPGARSVLSSSGEHGSSPGSLSGGADSYVLRVGTKLPQ